MGNYKPVESSFRDPSGFLFYLDGILYRQINQSYKQDYEHLMDSGLYKSLIDSNRLISHEEVDIQPLNPDKSYKIIKPEKISFISYPYEWCFSQLKHAAIATLEIQKTAMDFGMTLKDCSAYNIQFHQGKPILIDTLSFETYKEDQTWQAYRQFCQHFLAPLALMSQKDIRLNQLLRIYIDGIPLDLVSKLLPLRSRSSFSLFAHIHAHSKSQKHFESKSDPSIKERKMGRRSFLGVVESLYNGVKKLNWNPSGTEWGDYYTDTNYSKLAFEQKKKIIELFLDKVKPKTVWDLGANIGIFSRIASQKGIETKSFDIDPVAVEKNYLESVEKNETKLLPLLLDLANPSPDIGWENLERSSLVNRGPADMVMALALIHHLVVSNNLPMKKISQFMKKICNYLIIEFIPKTDSQVQRLLATREDIFDDYNLENFENEFKRNFNLLDSVKLQDSQRFLYLMQKKQ